MRYILFLLLLLFASCFDCRRYYSNKIKPIEINGIIDRAFIDNNNHGAKTILFKNQQGKGIVESWILGLYENAQNGDSIYKAKGSLAVYLYKVDTTLVFYPVCDGDTLK